ncbi:MAG: hypothetical protein PHG60_01700 [Candidatus Dojkabacteria bacterium]|jgi:hypothetical protein|nr:hypothetical protein [Candidatus Dojkabacteria bacterium]
MKKDTVWLIVAIVLLVGIVGGLVWIFGGFSGDGGEVPEDSQQEQVVEPEEIPEEVEKEESDPNISEKEDAKLDDVSVDSAVAYSANSQKVGEDTKELFTLKNLEVKKGDEVMEVEFTFTTDNITEKSSVPVSVVNKSNLGAMEIIVGSVSSDKTSMSYNESIKINREGITTFSKVVSGVSNTVKYNLGFTEAPKYYLYEPKLVSNSLVVKLSIKYPGGVTSPESTAMTEFTSEDVSVTGSTADNGVRIVGYTYSTSGGVIRYILKTSSNSGSPIPSYEGKLKEGTLTITFPSLSSDITYSSTEGKVSLPGGVVLNITRAGNQSVYEFVGVGAGYKISGVTSPNQVIIEVKL